MLNFYLLLLDTAEEKVKFEELYYTYRQDMFKTAKAILKNDFDSEDAVHEAFLIVVKKYQKFHRLNVPKHTLICLL